MSVITQKEERNFINRVIKAFAELSSSQVDCRLTCFSRWQFDWRCLEIIVWMIEEKSLELLKEIIEWSSIQHIQDPDYNLEKIPHQPSIHQHTKQDQMSRWNWRLWALNWNQSSGERDRPRRTIGLSSVSNSRSQFNFSLSLVSEYRRNEWSHGVIEWAHAIALRSLN